MIVGDEGEWHFKILKLLNGLIIFLFKISSIFPFLF